MPRQLRCESILLCDGIQTDQDTGKMSIIGLLDTVTCPGFPCTLPTMTIFLQLTNAQGKYLITGEVYDVATDKSEHLSGGLEVEIADPLELFRVAFVLPQFAIMHAGEYNVIAKSNGEELGRQRFRTVPPKPAN